MDIIVCIKQVPGSSKAEVDPVTGVLKRSAADTKMNPYDLFAIETAMQIKERQGGQVRVVTMGPPHAKEVIREAYMMGVDAGVLLTDKKFAGSDVLATSRAISQGIRQMDRFDLVLCGKQTTDGDTAQVGPEIAEYLGIPHAANVSGILEIKERSVIVEMDMADTVEVVEIRLPCLLSVDKNIFQPRLPSYLKKLSTKDKVIRMMSLKDFDDPDERKYGLSGSPTQVDKIFPPAVNQDRETWTGDSTQLSQKMAAKLKQLKFI